MKAENSPRKRLAQRIDTFAPAVAVTEILKLAERPEVISFAGGLPDPGILPVRRMRKAAERVLREEGAAALNYGPTPGFSGLREWIADWTARRYAVPLSMENILITSGGLEALSLTSMALLDPGSTVLVAAPTYLVALHVFRAYQARIVSVPVDGNGVSPEALETRISELCESGMRPRFVYLIPSFQNPSGLTLTEGRRKRIIEICSRFGVPILEDHAYADLRYGGPGLPALKSLAPESVIFVHTFSKILAPGVRLGWVAADAGLISTLALCKLATDQCANTLTQRLVHEFGRRGWIDEQIESSIEHYRRKRDLLLVELRQNLPATVSWTRPEGGFYTWLTLPPESDSEALLEKALREQNLAFVAGPPFFAHEDGARNLRLSFSFIPEEQIPEGVARLARVIQP